MWVIIAVILAGCDTAIPPENPPDKIHISVLFGQSNSDPGLEDMLIEKINKDFPHIELEWDSVDWGEYFAPELNAKIASGEVPDIIIGKAQDVSAYYNSGFLAPLSPMLYKNIRPETLNGVTVNGEVYGLPFNIFYQGIIYNKNIFWRYGIEPPDTLEKMNEVIARLNEVGITPFATHFRDNWYIGNIAMQFAANQVFIDNPVWGDEFRKGKLSFSESDEYRRCFEQVKLVLDNTWSDALTVSASECVKRFANDEAAMFITGSWSVQNIFQVRPIMSLGFFPYPNESGTAKLLFEPNLTFMKNSQSKYGDVIDDIFTAIFSDTTLSQAICAFTQTDSVFINEHSDTIQLISDDILKYTGAKQLADVNIGNNQLVWSFQYANALKIRDWLEGKGTIEDVLNFADSNRLESGS